MSQEFRSAKTAWRKSPLFPGSSSGTNVFSFPLSEELQIRDTSSLCVHNSSGLVAQGTCSFSGSDVQVIRVIPVERGGSDPHVEYNVLHRFSTVGPCYSLQWVDDVLIVASHNGEIHVYKLDPNELLKSSNSQLFDSHTSPGKIVPIRTFVHSIIKKKMNFVAPPPGEWTPSKRVQRISVNPSDKAEFLSVENHRVHLWDFRHPEAPRATAKGSKEPLFAAEWNPHNPDQMAIGGVTRTIKLLDRRSLRENTRHSVLWKNATAHDEPIRDIKWSPFLPYWLASAGDDATVRIWDLRFDRSPVLVLRGSESSVKHISWLKSHAELLVSGGRDGKLCLWNMNSPPNYLAASVKDGFTSPIVSVAAPQSSQPHVYGISSDGEFVTTVITSDILQKFIVSRFGRSEKEPREIEKFVYLRHVDKALRLVDKISDCLINDMPPEKAVQLFDLCFPADVDDSQLSPTVTQQEAFLSDVARFSYFMPPSNVIDCNVDPIDASVRDRVQKMRVRMILAKAVKENDVDELMLRRKNVLSSLKDDVMGIDVALLSSMCEKILEFDYEEGLSFGIAALRSFDNHDYFSNAAPLVRVLLSPSVVEFAEKSGSSCVSADLLSDRSVLEQLILQKDITVAMDSRNAAKDIHNCVYSFCTKHDDSSNFPASVTKILSVSVLYMFLEALIFVRKYDTFFVAVTHILAKYGDLEFCERIRRLSEDVCFPRFRAILEDTAAVSVELSLQKSAILTTSKILRCSPSLPSYFSDFLPSKLSELKWNLENHLESMSATEHGKHEAVNFARAFLQEMKEVERMKAYGESDGHSFFGLSLRRFLDKNEERLH